MAFLEQSCTNQRKRLDPRAALLGAILLSLVIACLENFTGCFIALCLGFTFLLFSKPSPRWVLCRIAIANIFILFIWLVVPWTASGIPVWHLGFLTFSDAGIEICLLVTIKANALIAIFLSLIAPMSISQLGSGLYQLHCPDKLAWLFLLMGRNIHILNDEWNKLSAAAKLRGFHPESNLHTYKTLSAMLAILLMRAHERGLKMREAMLLRGYNGKLPFVYNLQFSVIDFFFSIIICIAVFILIYMEYNGAP